MTNMAITDAIVASAIHFNGAFMQAEHLKNRALVEGNTCLNTTQAIRLHGAVMRARKKRMGTSMGPMKVRDWLVAG